MGQLYFVKVGDRSYKVALRTKIYKNRTQIIYVSRLFSQ